MRALVHLKKMNSMCLQRWCEILESELGLSATEIQDLLDQSVTGEECRSD